MREYRIYTKYLSDHPGEFMSAERLRQQYVVDFNETTALGRLRRITGHEYDFQVGLGRANSLDERRPAGASGEDDVGQQQVNWPSLG